MDSLSINDLELWTHIGVPEEERRIEQRVLVSIELSTDLSPVGKNDDVTKGIDYEKIVADVRELAQTERKTIERLAEDIAETVLLKYQSKSVKVSIQKNPLPGVRGACVTIERP
jgi:FolB domain-containing protein